MQVLLIGGTGNISMGIIKALRTRYGSSAGITVFNRGQSDDVLPPDVTRLHGDRNDFSAFEKQFAESHYDAVIDMICFRPDQAQSVLRAFAGKSPHYIFCSTVCTYGNTQTIIPTPESATPRPHSDYGKNKLACEQIFLEASRKGAFHTSTTQGGATVLRPSHTFGPGFNFHGNLGGNGSPGFIDRLRKGLPVVVSGDGHGLWQIAASDDVGKGFAYAIGKPHTYHEVYNIASDHVITWDELTRNTAAALGAPEPKIVHIPTDLLLALDPVRFGSLQSIFQYHGVYSNAKIHRDIPEYRETTDFAENVRNTVKWMEAHGKLRTAESDPYESQLIEMYQAFGRNAQKQLATKPA
jgi:nucleoside-diphosphate-sugar epimerase